MIFFCNAILRFVLFFLLLVVRQCMVFGMDKPSDSFSQWLSTCAIFSKDSDTNVQIHYDQTSHSLSLSVSQAPLLSEMCNSNIFNFLNKSENNEKIIIQLDVFQGLCKKLIDEEIPTVNNYAKTQFSHVAQWFVSKKKNNKKKSNQLVTDKTEQCQLLEKIFFLIIPIYFQWKNDQLSSEVEKYKDLPVEQQGTEKIQLLTSDFNNQKEIFHKQLKEKDNLISNQSQQYEELKAIKDQEEKKFKLQGEQLVLSQKKYEQLKKISHELLNILGQAENGAGLDQPKIEGSIDSEIDYQFDDEKDLQQIVEKVKSKIGLLSDELALQKKLVDTEEKQYIKLFEKNQKQTKDWENIKKELEDEIKQKQITIVSFKKELEKTKQNDLEIQKNLTNLKHIIDQAAKEDDGEHGLIEGVEDKKIADGDEQELVEDQIFDNEKDLQLIVQKVQHLIARMTTELGVKDKAIANLKKITDNIEATPEFVKIETKYNHLLQKDLGKINLDLSKDINKTSNENISKTEFQKKPLYKTPLAMAFYAIIIYALLRDYKMLFDFYENKNQIIPFLYTAWHSYFYSI